MDQRARHDQRNGRPWFTRIGWLGLLAMLAGATLTRTADDDGVAAQAATPTSAALDAAWLAGKDWDDGAAVVSVFRGRIKRYGAWRAAEVRDYLIREYLDPEELTKRDEIRDGLIPVLKLNRHVTFSTGTYDYRRMTSLFLDRRSGGLVRAVGSSQDGCGLTFQRWARGVHSWDSYWEGEGSGRTDRPRTANARFADETPYVARLLPDGAALVEWPSLGGSRVKPWSPREYRLERGDREVVVRDEKGTERARYAYDEKGFLLRWRIAGEEELERVVKRRLYYWEHTAPGDEKLLRDD